MYIKLDTLLETIPNLTLIQLTAGAYNQAAYTGEWLQIEDHPYLGSWVIKTPIHPELCELNHIDRAVRNWNAMNPPSYPAIKLDDTRWMLPYFGSAEASDEETQAVVIEAYRENRRIIPDAYVKGNVLKYQGKAIIVDIDQAVKRGSFASDQFLDGSAYMQLQETLSRPSLKLKTKATLQTLLYLEKQLPAHLIKDIYITKPILDYLHKLKQKDQLITVDLLETLAAIESLDSTGMILKNSAFLTQQTLKELSLARQEGRLTTAYLREEYQERFWDPNYHKQLTFPLDVQSLIEEDKNIVHRVGKSGFTLLHLAALWDDHQLIEQLIDLGADVNAVCQSPTQVQNNGLTALDLAFREYKQLTFQYLINRGGAHSDSVNQLIQKLNPQYVPIMRIFQLRERLRSLAEPQNYPFNANDAVFFDFILENPHFLFWTLDVKNQCFIHHIFLNQHLALIERLQQQPSWYELVEASTPTGQTLWHLVVEANELYLLKYLSVSNINAVTNDTKETALHIAASKRERDVCEALISLGADMSLFNRKHQRPRDIWGGEDSHFTDVLRYLTKLTEPNNIPSATQNMLLDYAMQYPQVMLLPFEEYSFLHYVFCYNHHSLIEQVISHPQWEILAHQARSEKTNISLLSVLAFEGHQTYYPLLKKMLATPYMLVRTLRIAIVKNQYDFCELFFEDQISPELLFENFETLTHAITFKFTKLLAHMATAPSWPDFVKQCSKKHDQLILKTLVAAEDISIYQLFAPYLDPLQFEFTIKLAAEQGKAAFCREVLIDSPHPLTRYNQAMSLVEYWDAHHDQADNPFREIQPMLLIETQDRRLLGDTPIDDSISDGYTPLADSFSEAENTPLFIAEQSDNPLNETRNARLMELKVQISTLLHPFIPKYGCTWTKTHPIRELQRRLESLAFAEDSPDVTADDLIKQVMNNWEEDFPQYAKNLIAVRPGTLRFFLGHGDVLSVLDHIRNSLGNLTADTSQLTH